MKIKYFSDTDTALIEFVSHPVAETREIGDNVLIDLDQHGNLVNMTIEHAKERMDFKNVAIKELLSA